ncbi:MAG: type II secretion system protein [Deltaproteobacteria bacterium]|jgi:prepilin-type N-terminal cleavage/methylation domain-containing protein|nr:type II secretion system protein [Deltaproteobacteria bacterium]
MNRKGFTLIELILVIAILGILAISALPRFLDLSTSAEHASRDGVIGAVRSGIALYRANDMVTNGGAGSYPATLGTNSTPAACTACFDTVLSNGIADASWTKAGTAYSFNDGAATVTYNYNATNGTFE